MYLHNALTRRLILRESVFILSLSFAYSAIIVLLREFMNIQLISIPVLPVTTIGIAVSLYLGFKSNQAYSRWWEARTIWGTIISGSRAWAISVLALAQSETGKPIDRSTQRLLIHRHLAWVHALAMVLRKERSVRKFHPTRIFDHAVRIKGSGYAHTPKSYQAYLPKAERSAIADFNNVPAHILHRQAQVLSELATAGSIDSFRHVALNQMVLDSLGNQGACERIKNTPFPRVIDVFGRAFTWIFLAMLPLAHIDTFEIEAASHTFTEVEADFYILIMIPMAMALSWIFYFMEKVSEALEDPFEGSANDVPISTMTRTIEINLLEMLGEEAPAPLPPLNGVAL